MSLMVKIRLAVIAMLILALVTPISGCGSNESSNESSKDVMARMMKMIPANTGDFSFSNFKAYREDDMLRNLLSEGMQEYSGGTFFDLVDYWGEAHNPNFSLFVGKFKSLDSVVQFYNSGHQEFRSYYEYRGMTVASGDYYDLALLEGTCIIAYSDKVKQCMDIFLDGKPSFYDHSGFKEVLDHLRDGLNMEILDASSYSEDIIAEGSSTIFVGNGFQTINVTLTKDGNFLERLEFQALPAE